MPQYMDRHAGTSDGYGSEPSRSQQRRLAVQDDPATRRPPAKKDPDTCKGRHWKAGHTPVFRLRAYGPKPRECQWWADWTGKVTWSCWHELACSGCGKILVVSVKGEQCPDYREITGEEQARLDSEKQARADRVARWNARRVRRPVIDGPQGYRKPKGNT